jgi:hypothetical protein
MRRNDFGGEKDQRKRRVDTVLGVIEVLYTYIYLVFEIILEFAGKKIRFFRFEGQQTVLPDL